MKGLLWRNWHLFLLGDHRPGLLSANKGKLLPLISVDTIIYSNFLFSKFTIYTKKVPDSFSDLEVKTQNPNPQENQINPK